MYIRELIIFVIVAKSALQKKNIFEKSGRWQNHKIIVYNMLHLLQVETKGLSGPIEFKEGRRIGFKLDVVKLKEHSVMKVGEWSPTTRLNISDNAAFFDSASLNVTLVVITILVGNN